MHPDDAGFSRGRPSGEMQLRGWFRLPDDQPLDTLALVLATDAYPPTIFNADLPVAWTPTVELTAHVRARPALAGCGAPSPPGSSPGGSSRRTAWCGTTPAPSWPSPANSPSSPARLTATGS